MKTIHNIGVNEGDCLELISSTRGDAYLGFTGTVKLDSEGFSLFNGHSWLTCLNLHDCKFRIMKRNETGLFHINKVPYYSQNSVLHKPKKCCKCGFIPVEYIVKWWKTYCTNCYKK